MAKKFYVVWVGHKPGIYTTWDDAKLQVDKFAGAKYKSFPTQAEAKAAFNKSPSSSLGASTANSTTKAGSAKASTSTSRSSKAGEGASIKSATANNSVLAKFDVVIYTDGGCDPNPGKAGSGIAIYQGGQLSELHFGLYNPNGTNNTAELNALHQAIVVAKQFLAAGKTVHILADSQYAIKCINEWAYGWKANGWKRKTGEIANLELIKQAHELYDSLHTALSIQHVAAHVGIEGNELADRMSIHAVDTKTVTFEKYTQEIDLKSILNMRAG